MSRAMPDPAADPVLDPSMLANLRRIGGPAVLTRFIDTFLDYAPGRLAAAEDALRAGDVAAVAAVAHGLISSAGQLGAAQLSAASREIEALASAGDLTAVAQRSPAWRQAFDAAVTALRATRTGS